MFVSSGKYLRGPVFLLVILCLLLPCLLSAGCGEENAGGDGEVPGDSTSQPERNITLTTLAQGITSEYGRFDEMPIQEDGFPESMVITDEEEYRRLTGLVMLQDLEEEVDFDRYIVIAALQGPKSTGGYAISIIHASQKGTGVRIEIDVVEPEPGSMTVQILTSPYHLVLAERSAFDPRGELIFTFIDQNDAQLARQGVDI